MKSKLKIFGHPWHIGHQYSLITSMPEYNFYYILDRFRPWKENNRPIPKNLYFVDHYQPGEYDLAILHLDQQCLYDAKKGMPYNELNRQIEDIPKIVINHGTPYFMDKEKDDIKYEMKKRIGDNLMIVNSEQAWREWGFGKYIIHGISAADFKPAKKKENRIITAMSPCYDLLKDGWAKYYGREFFKSVKEKIDIVHIGQDILFDTPEKYKNYLAESLIYFNPTKHSPMPRSRTEAMLAGCAVVSTPFHDWNKYIENGKNGFIISGDNVEEAIEVLGWLRRNPSKAEKIGREGRKAAIHHFNPERYRQDWLMTIKRVLSGHLIGQEVRQLKKQIEDLVYLIPGAHENRHWKSILNNTLENFSKKIWEF